VTVGDPTANVAETPVGSTSDVPVTVTVPNPKVADTPVGDILGLKIKEGDPTLNVAETPVGVINVCTSKGSAKANCEKDAAPKVISQQPLWCYL
jgi:hypothetical protein